MNDQRGRSDADNCFVCGQNNSIGLKIEFRLDGDVCRGDFTPNQDHVGFDGVTHGGILFSTLDDVMANWLFLQGVRATTARSEIRFRATHPPGTLLRLEGRIVRKKGSLIVMEGKAIRNDTESVVAESQASFMVSDWGDIRGEISGR
jgi:acyl-coenzyme A thioesterase PaaI-like protein